MDNSKERCVFRVMRNSSQFFNRRQIPLEEIPSHGACAVTGKPCEYPFSKEPCEEADVNKLEQI